MDTRTPHNIKPQVWLFHVVVFADDGQEMDTNEKCTCRACKAIVFAHKICKFVTFSLPWPWSLLKLPISSARPARAFYILIHFFAVLVLTTT